MGVVFGLLAALFWGSGDYLINRLTVRSGTIRGLAVTQSLSLLCWLVALVALWPSGPIDSGTMGRIVLSGLFHVAGMVLTYRAFEVGTLSIVSPVASSFAIVTATLAVATGERPGAVALGGVLALVSGVALVTHGSSSDGESNLRGLPEALGSAVCFGVMFWLIEEPTKRLGMALPLVVLKTMMTVTALAALWVVRKKEPPLGRHSLAELFLLGGAVALADSLAWGAWILGARSSFNTVVTALASLFSAVTVLLAALLLKERLNRAQLAGVGVILAGILLVSR